MDEATPEQRLAWLQYGLREIGKMCLHLGTPATGTPEAPPAPGLETPPPTLSTPPLTLSTPPSPLSAPPPIGGAITLEQFLASVQELSLQERLTVVDAAITMLAQLYVHLPLKRAMHGIDPLQRLRLLQQRVLAQLSHHIADESVQRFHDEMIEIFHSLRDLHTNYILPSSYQGKTAFLPFLVEEYFEDNPPAPHYLVTRTLPGFSHPTFKVGITVTYWNGIPIARAVELNAAREAGSNPEARHARGLEALTLRAMALSAPPDEAWVIIGYQTGGQNLEVRLAWQVTAPAPSASGVDVNAPLATMGEAARVMGFDAQTEAVHRAKKFLFVPDEIVKEQHMAQVMARATAPGSASAETAYAGTAHEAHRLGYDVQREALRQVRAAMRFPDMAAARQELAQVATTAGRTHATGAPDPQTTSLLPDFFAFRPVTTPSGVFGYIRIYSFMARDANEFVAEFERMAKLLPQNGLIIDVRGNGGGNINAGEQLLQVLTSTPIEPERFHFINSPTTLALCQSEASLADWIDSIGLAVQTGETYSQGFPLTSAAMMQHGSSYHYPGKLVLVIDALCYSTTDIFTAGFQDHRIGKILGTGGRTGAGGANVWTYDFFTGLPGFEPLPKGVSFRTAIRRSTRVGAKAGVPLEDLGVQPDDVHLMTRKDILETNVDLIAKAGAMLTT